VVGAGFLLLVSLVLNASIAAMRISVPRAATFLMSYLVIAALFAATSPSEPCSPHSCS